MKINKNVTILILIAVFFFYILMVYFFLSNNYYSIPKRTKFSPTLFCLIKTHPKNIKSNRTSTVYDVWARKCDNYRFVTLIPKELIAKNIRSTETLEVFDKFYMIQPKGLVKETHSRLSLKVYYAMVYVFEKFPNFDWYYIVDDDVYANIENFKEFLKDKNPQEAITFGYVIKLFVRKGYHSGGPGYVLSNEAFTRVSSALKKNIKNCPDSGIDDVDVNKCVRKYNGTIGNSCDEKNRDRFIVMKPKAHLMGEFPSWMKKHGGCKALKGIDCCADSPVAFHYMKSEDMVRMNKAFEIQKNIVNWFDGHSKKEIGLRFRDLARIYLMLEDLEFNTTEYQKYMNYSTF